MKRWSPWLALAVAAAWACSDWFAPPLESVRLNIVPVLSERMLAQSDPDLVSVQIFLDSVGSFPSSPAIHDTLTINPVTREANGDFTIPLLQSPSFCCCD